MPPRNPAQSGPPRIAPMAKPRQRHVGGARRIRLRELAPFTRKLAAMLDAGLPLIQCLEALAEQCEHREFKRVIVQLRTRVEAGDSFAEALYHYTDLFGELYISMIRAGELGGSLSEVAARLAAYLENSAALRRRVKSAMAYPAVVMVMALILSTAMLIFIVPTFESIYADFGAKLPAPTRMLMVVSVALRRYFPFVLIGLILAIYLFNRFRKSQRGAYLIDRYLLRAPVFGQLIEKIALARIARTFASLIRSGVPILRTVEIVATAAGNRFIGSALAKCGAEIEGGGSIATSLKHAGCFPPMVVHMIAVGEKTGNIDGMLEKVADFYEDEVKNTLDALSSMIEPLLIAFLGVVIGTIVICMFLPIFKMHEIVAM